MGFLSEIVRETHRAIEAPSYGEGLPEASTRERSSIRRAIERDRGDGAWVVEYKRVSPGHGPAALPPRSVKQFVDSMRHAKFAAYSCLATIPRFEGSPNDVSELASRTRRPVLFKDFIVDRRQLGIAARAGASAVLLIARLETEGLLAERLSSLAKTARSLGLEVLLEFHARAELSRVEGVAADVYGVNTRDLDTLRIDRAAAFETLRELHSRGLRPVLGMSGVSTADDAALFWERGVDGILIGSALARAEEPARFLASIPRRPSRGPG